MKGMSKYVVRAVALAVVFVGVYACAHMQNTNTTSSEPVSSSKVGNGNGIDFSLPDQNDEMKSISAFRGKVVLISFWATWCNPCKEEIPILADIQNRYAQQGVVVVSVNVDTPDMTSEARSYVATLPPNLIYLFDPDSSTTGFLNPSHDLPFVVLLDQQGNVVWKHHGFAPGDEEEMESQIKKLISK